MQEVPEGSGRGRSRMAIHGTLPHSPVFPFLLTPLLQCSLDGVDIDVSFRAKHSTLIRRESLIYLLQKEAVSPCIYRNI